MAKKSTASQKKQAADLKAREKEIAKFPASVRDLFMKLHSHAELEDPESVVFREWDVIKIVQVVLAEATVKPLPKKIKSYDDIDDAIMEAIWIMRWVGKANKYDALAAVLTPEEAIKMCKDIKKELAKAGYIIKKKEKKENSPLTKKKK